jgi:hypothetical protein
MTTKNRGYVSDKPKDKPRKTKTKDKTGRAGKKGGDDKRKRISE